VSFNEFCYVEIAFGDVRHRGQLVDVDGLNLEQLTGENFVSLYRFDQQAYRYVQSKKTVAGLPSLPVWADYLWLDIDSPDLDLALNATRKVLSHIEGLDSDLCYHIRFYFSGAKGFHIGLPGQLAGFRPSEELPHLHKLLALALADGVEIDTSIYGQTRLFRLANTLNKKSGLYKVQLTIDQLRSWTVAEIKEHAKIRRGNAHLNLLSSKETPQTNARLVELLEEAQKTEENKQCCDGIKSHDWVYKALTEQSEGNRHTNFSQVIGWLLSPSKSMDVICQFLMPYAERSGYPLGELEEQVRDFCVRYGQDNTSVFDTTNSKQTQTELKAISLAELLDTTDPRIEWQIQSLIPVQTATIIAGPASAGKSFLLLDLSLAVVTGTRFADSFDAKKGVVLYIDEENGPQILCNRLRRLMEGRNLSEPPADLHFCVDQRVLMDDITSLSALDKVLTELNPDVVVIDTLKRVTHREENSATEMAKVFSAIRYLITKHHAAFIIADHHRKPSKFASSPEQLLRGSSDKAAFVDCLVTVKKIDDDIILAHTKSRATKATEPIVVTLRDVSEGAIRIEFKGFAKDIQGKARAEQALEWLLDKIGNEWRSRQDLVRLGKQADISEQMIDKALKFGCRSGHLMREERKVEGRGGKSYYFKRNDSDTDEPISELAEVQ